MTLKKTKAWRNFSLHVRQVGKCFTCGKITDPRELDGGHFFHRSAIMFFDPRFVRAQCTGCNRFKHGNLGIFARLLIEEIGIEEFKKAEIQSKKFKRWSIKELKEIEIKYMKELGMKPIESKKQCRHKMKPPYCTICFYKKAKKVEKKSGVVMD